MQTRWAGCGTALVTPFTKSGDLDEAAVRRLARRQVDGGVHFLVPCGTTGESPTLSHAEKLRVVELVVDEANGAVPVLAGAGGYDTRADHGAGPRPGEQPAQRRHPLGHAVLQQADSGRDCTGTTAPSRAATELPIVLYNVPGRTACNIAPATLLRLAEIPNVVGVKEASGDLGQICEICRAVPDDFCVLSGDDAFTLAVMALGGSRCDLGHLERGAGRDGVAGRSGRRRETSRRRAPRTSGCCR